MTGDERLRQPIIILGAPRSGTTLLGHVLSQHPELSYLEEPRLTWRFGNDAKSDMLRPEDARPEVIEHIRRAFAERVQAQGRRRLLEKTPSNALRPAFVDRVFPDAKFIHIVRNGYDSVLSIEHYWRSHSGGMKVSRLRQRLREARLNQSPRYAKELLRRVLPQRFSRLLGRRVWGPRLPGMNALLNELDTLQIACLQWRACVETTHQFMRGLPPERGFECRLEDMSWNLMEQILKFCDLPPSDAVERYFAQQFNPSQSGQRRREVDPAKHEAVRTWIEPTVVWLNQEMGLPTTSSDNSSPSATAR